MLMDKIIILENGIIIDRISDKMYDRQISTKQLADELGIDVSLIYRCLRGVGLLQTQYMIKLADYFCCSLDYLLGIENNDYVGHYRTSHTFGQRLTHIYQTRNITEYRVMKDTSLSRTSLHDWRYNIRMPSLSNLVTLARYLDCSVDYLVGREI